MDPCECVWDHEFAMRRLLNLLRNSQTVCTDSECFDEGPASSPPGTENALMVTLIWVIVFFLYLYRPSTRRAVLNSKPSNQDSQGAPPNPPPSAM
ncbi:small integral membrane protein 14 [Harmonia axyridis]|uniref:small integral membrane protein 14 n=1 Tax=Harmonia axyridis TaxID=115357 RepID=UPI001E2761ED|nr:small integral membrane protein 14 [Harmonia axyridis]XP_045474571.1 small integral membrane protein 14 [Harmonia axyridis]